MFSNSTVNNCDPQLLWLYLSMIKGISETKLNRLAALCDYNPEMVKEEIERQNEQREESKKYQFSTLDEAKKRWQIYSQKYTILTVSSRDYPQQLLDLEDPPSILYCRGSGKSSLAFDTIYAEGQRRYLETFSSYIRNFMGNMSKPDVDKIS